MDYELKKASVRLRLNEESGVYSTTPFSSPEVAVDGVRKTMETFDTETVCVVNVDSKNKPINYIVASIGDLNTCIVPMRNVFKAALLSNAAKVIMMHNHPSGLPEPSGEDYSVTEKVIKAGKLMGIELLDHIIVGNGIYYSFRENNPEMEW